METIPYKYPLRILLATTGLSTIARSLFGSNFVQVAGIIDCRNSGNSCYEYAKQHYIPHCFFHSFAQMNKWMTPLNVDLMIVYKMPFLLPPEIIEIPRYGAINIHPSLLPLYRGANPWFWLYYHMESRSGVTIHKIDNYADHGDILAQISFPITMGEILPVVQKYSEIKAALLLKYVLMHWYEIKPIPQKSISNSVYATNHIDYDNLLDLNRIEGIRLWHLLRGFPWLLKKLYPDASLNSYKIGVFIPRHSQKKIGHIVKIENKDYFICCDGMIEVIKY